jgi:hypothetical protein
MHYLYYSREPLIDALPAAPPDEPATAALAAGDANNVPVSAAEQGVIAASHPGGTRFPGKRIAPSDPVEA